MEQQVIDKAPADIDTNERFNHLYLSYKWTGTPVTGFAFCGQKVNGIPPNPNQRNCPECFSKLSGRSFEEQQ